MIDILPAIVLLAIALALLSIRVLLVKGGRFRRGHSCQFDPEAGKHHRKNKTIHK